MTEFIQSVYRDNPLLFESILSRSEVDTLDIDQDSDDLEPSVSIEADNNHRRPSAIGSLRVTYVQDILRFPVHQKHMDNTFQKALSSAYSSDYGERNVLYFGRIPLQWVKKISFTHRYVLKAGRLDFSCHHSSVTAESCFAYEND